MWELLEDSWMRPTLCLFIVSLCFRYLFSNFFFCFYYLVELKCLKWNEVEVGGESMAWGLHWCPCILVVKLSSVPLSVCVFHTACRGLWAPDVRIAVVQWHTFITLLKSTEIINYNWIESLQKYYEVLFFTHIIYFVGDVALRSNNSNFHVVKFGLDY